MHNKMLLAFILCNIINTITAAPSSIIIMCHGETKNSNLSLRGIQRAYALVPFFTPTPLTHEGDMPKDAIYSNGIYFLPALYGQPAALYAQGKEQSNNFGVQPVATLQPLAKELSLPINQRVIANNAAKKKFKDYAQLCMPFIEEIINNPNYRNRTILMCWNAKTIPALCQALLSRCANENIQLPKHLKKAKIFKQHDRIFRFTFDKNGKITNLDNIAQELLCNDSLAATSEFYSITNDQITRTK